VKLRGFETTDNDLDMFTSVKTEQIVGSNASLTMPPSWEDLNSQDVNWSLVTRIIVARYEEFVCAIWDDHLFIKNSTQENFL
jgi:hypothetical protein